MEKGKRVRLEPEVKAFAVELNNEYKRMRNLIPNKPKLAMVAAVLKVADLGFKEVDVSDQQ